MVRGQTIHGLQKSEVSDLFIDGQRRMDWQEEWLIVIDEVSMLGARTLFAVNEQLRKLRGSDQDFGGIPIVLFCGDFYQFRPVRIAETDGGFERRLCKMPSKTTALPPRFTCVRVRAGFLSLFTALGQFPTNRPSN